MRLSLLLALVLALFRAEGPATGREVRVSYFFTRAERPAVERAVAEWSAARPALGLRLVRGECAASAWACLVPMTSKRIQAVSGVERSVGFTQHVDGGPTRLLVASDYPEYLHRIALHEIGHALGLQHVEPREVPYSVMTADVLKATEDLTETDIAAAAAVGN